MNIRTRAISRPGPHIFLLCRAVLSLLLQAGYDGTVDQWGQHNTVITSIKKDGIELIPYDDTDYTFGYDDPRDYFPAPLVSLLDDKLPPSDGYYEILW